MGGRPSPTVSAELGFDLENGISVIFRSEGIKVSLAFVHDPKDVGY
jgi:hypothetical protein